MSTDWTPSQKNAIEARGGTVLVSAAAGSGKTAVLVQRVIERITDKASPVNVENLLVVTFAKAAAAEMRERIGKVLSKKIEENPTDSFLKRQKMFLPNAGICTMDSFCQKLVKENFQKLDILPDFSMLSEPEHKILKMDVVQQVLEEVYAENGDDTAMLLDLFSNGRNDENLINSILSIYDFSMAAPNPEKWIEKHFSYYFENCSAEQSIWGRYALKRLSETAKYITVKIDKIILDAGDGKLGTVARENLESVENQLRTVISLIENKGAWNDIKNTLDSIKFGSFGRFKEEEKDGLFFEIKERYASVKSDVEKAQKILCCYSDEFTEDMEYLRPVMSSFKRCVLRFSELLLSVKKEKNTYYFSDILHMTLNLLVVCNDDGTIQKTDLAKELSDTYDEILIDEFQDTNEAQNALFDAISKNSENKFMVGDVKQSIYRFRQAMPEIFISLKDAFSEYNAVDYPANISLDRNFRSRKGVVDAVNFFFNILMTRKMGDIDYKNGEQLVFAADYSESDNCDTQVHIVTSPSPKASNLENESRYIAGLIDDIVHSGLKVGRKGEERPVRYGDICILMRTLKNKAPVVARTLTAAGIPVHFKKNGGFFDNAEIVTMISLLRVIDNPVQDVPLVSVMLSPMFPFTEDDIASMRCRSRKSSVYGMLTENYETDGKVKYFLDTINLLRTLSVTLSVGELIRRVFEITSYDSVVGAMNNGEKRALNLRMLISYAEAYESNGKNGLSGFIRYVDKLRRNNFDLEDANTVSENDNVVRIMSIHKSKGLEFPVVILANCSEEFAKDNRSKALTDKTMGIGALRYDKSLNKEFETQTYTSVKLKNEYEDLCEAMRVLYVAMTRAKEKLYIVGSMYSPRETVRKLYCSRYTGFDENFVALSHCQSFMQWIMLAMLYHPEAGDFVKNCGILNSVSASTDSRISLIIADSPEEQKIEESESEKALPDDALLTEIRKKASYVYPYAFLSGTALKYTASNMDKNISLQYLAAENPAFMGAEELTPAQRGTLTHKFMEKCDFSSAGISVKDELCRLINDGVFTEQEAKAINTEKISKFFKSDVYKRISSAERFLRESEFTMSIPVSCINAETNCDLANEKAVVQGVIDGLIINGVNGEIIDYKTDRVKTDEELIEKYIQQMRIYKTAAEECFGIKNVKVTLYSFGLSKEITINL